MSTQSPAAGQSWRDAGPAPLVLLLGPEEYFAQRARMSVLAGARAAAPELELTQLDASVYEPGALAMAASPSLFGEAKFISIDRLEAMNEAFLKDALRYLEAPDEQAVVLLRHAGGVRGKKLLDQLKKSWPVIACQPLKKDTEKTAFVNAEFRAGRRRIEGPAIHALVQAVGSATAELATACTQLMQDTEGTITAEMVDTYYGGRVEASAFKVADAALAGNAPLALRTLRFALDSGADPVPLVASLAAKLRTLAKVAGSRGSSAQIAKELGMQSWLVEQAQRDVRKWNPAALTACIRAVAEADAQVKGLSRDPVYAVERVVLLIAESVR